jgi:DNA-binding SARP family transcriptional activator
LHVRLLGDFSLAHSDRQVTGVNAARLQSLLAYLILHRHAPQSREQLAFLFWPDSREAQALNNLRKALHHLRQHLPDADAFIHADAKTLQWFPDAPFTLDVQEFEQALDAAQRCAERRDAPAVRAHLTRAIGIYLGDLLPGCYDDWVAPQREHLRDRYVTALGQLTALLEEQGDIPAAIQFANQRLRSDPLSELAYRHLMQLHMSNGDTASALRAYHACVTALQRELNIAPGALTQQVYERLVHADAAPMPADQALPSSTALVGRADELIQLQRALADVMRGHPRCVVLSGEAGIGKTRLIEAFYSWLAQRDLSTAYTRAYAAEGALAYAPVAAWLRTAAFKPRWGRLAPVWLTELARVLPELLVEQPDLPPPRPITESWQRKQLFEALARALQACGRPLVLALDDAQWCDRDTLEWLHYLLRFDSTMPLLVILGVRLGEARLDAGSDHPLAALLFDLHVQQQVTELELGALSKAESFDLAAQAVGHPLPAAELQRLHRDSQGNPLFIVEMARAQSAQLNGEGDAPYEAATTALPLPPKVRAVIRARVSQLSPSARYIAQIAAVIGREFTPEVAALASLPDVTHDAFVQGLDELWQRRIVREHSADSYDFSHDRIRDVVMADIGPAGRKRLHRRVADALMRTYGERREQVSGRIAAHLDAAGAFEESIPHYLLAAKVARDVIAYEEEADGLRKGLQAIERLPAGAQRDEHKLTFLLARAFALLPSRGAADAEQTQLYRDALPLCTLPGHEAQLYQAQRGLWLHHLWQGQASLARDFAQKNLTLFETTDDRVRAGEAERCLAMAEWMLGNLASARQHIEQAIHLNPPAEMLRQSDVMDLWHGTDHVNTSAIMLWLSGYPDQALKRSEEGMAFNRALQQPFAVVCALEFHAIVHYLLHQPAEGSRAADELVSLSTQYGFPQNVDIGHLHQGWPLAAAGHAAQGIVLLKQGIDGCIRSRMFMMLSLYWAMLARMQADAGLRDEAQASLAEAFALAKRNDEHFWLAELQRLRGDLLLAGEDSLHDAEACYQQALAIARQQGAKSLELRAAISLARLWQRQGKLHEAQAVLSQTYAWFTEGFATADLQEAASLLAELAPAQSNSHS